MVGPYPGLPRDVAATVPRRAPLRHSWVRDAPLPRPSTPPAPSPQPLEVEVAPYCPVAPLEVQGCPGHVSRARALFETPPPPLSPPRQQEEVPEVAAAVTLRVRSPFSPAPPRANKRRHTVAAPTVDQHGDLIPQPAPPRPALLTVKRVTPVVMVPRPAPRYLSGGGAGECGQQAPRAASLGENVQEDGLPPPPRDAPPRPATMLGAPTPPRPHPRPAAPYTRFSDIPRHLLECLQESSVDPPAPPPSPGGAGDKGLPEGPTCPDTRPHHHPHPHHGADTTDTSNGLPPAQPSPPTQPSPPPQPSPPSTLIRENFRGFCSTMLDAPARPPSPTRPHHAHTPTLDEELWAAGVYFRRPGSPPRPAPLVRERRPIVKNSVFGGSGVSGSGKIGSALREPTILECELEESVLRELDSSLAGLSDGSGSSSPSGGSVRVATSHSEPLNLIEEVMVETRPAPPPSPPPPSTVTLRAYYQYPSPAPALPPPPQDSDSGHESGATSPCGTLTGEDGNHTPPSSPHTAHQDLGVGVSVVGGDSGCVGVRGVSLEPRPPTHFVVVAIDFGTTYSGYAFSFTSDPDSVHMMKQWEGGDPGVQNQKTPTTLLLTPEGHFHSFGYLARDTYHDLDPSEAPNWLYFDKFKMVLHSEETLSRDTQIEASNGRRLLALQVFSHALRYFRDHALRELSDQAGVGGGVGVLEEDVRWVLTVPAIWSHPAKQFMRTAAYQAGMGSPSRPDQLLIALEPEVAAIYCRRLRRHQLLPPSSSSSSTRSLPPHLQEDPAPPPSPDLDRGKFSVTFDLSRDFAEGRISLPYRSLETVADWLQEDTVYAVVDCGGGTVDITVHQMTDRTSGHLKELHKATGGPHGSTGVDAEFERLLETIFGREFMVAFRKQRPAAHVDLMIAFEARKRNASPRRNTPLNIALPFSFVDLYRKLKGKDVESAVRKQQHLGVRWSSQGMLRLEPEAMNQLFLPTLNSITKAIEDVFASPEVRALQYMFLVGGFAESEVLQRHIREAFSRRVRVVIPQGTGLAILRGAVQYGLDPGVVTVRRSRMTYGVGVLNRFRADIHPREKRVTSSGGEWCADVLDRFVVVDESVAVGDVVVRSYTPATPAQRTVILHVYATDRHDAQFVTEPGVERVGTLHLDLGPPPPPPPHHHHQHSSSTTTPAPQKREISVHMKFGDTEVKATAIDHLTRRCVRADIDFLTL